MLQLSQNIQRQMGRFVEVAQALRPSNQDDLKKFHVAGIYKRKRLVALAHNQKKTHPQNIRYRYAQHCYLHAELAAVIRGRQEDYAGHTMVVVRVNNQGKLNESKPCACCAEVIRQMNFAKVLASNSQGEIVDVTADVYGSKALTQRSSAHAVDI